MPGNIIPGIYFIRLFCPAPLLAGDQSGHLPKGDNRTAQKIAKQFNVGSATVERAGYFVDGLNAAEIARLDRAWGAQNVKERPGISTGSFTM